MNLKWKCLFESCKIFYLYKNIYPTVQNYWLDFMFCCITAYNFEHFCGVLEKNSQEHDLKSQTMIKKVIKKAKKAPYCNVGLKWICCVFGVKEKQVYILVWIFFYSLDKKERKKPMHKLEALQFFFCRKLPLLQIMIWPYFNKK